MQVETKFLRLFREVTIGDRFDGWRVCWIGGWDKCRVLFVVMVERRLPAKRSAREINMRLRIRVSLDSFLLTRQQNEDGSTSEQADDIKIVVIDIDSTW